MPAKAAVAAISRVCLEPLERSHLSASYISWLNDPEVTRYMETGIFPITADDAEQFLRSVSGSRDQVAFAIMHKESGQHIGNVKLGPIHWVHRCATFGIMIGEKKFWGHGLGEEATRLTADYAFFRLNLRRIDLGVFAEHAAAVRCYEKIGFQVEGKLRQELFQGGEYKDRLWMGLLRSEYQAPGKRK